MPYTLSQLNQMSQADFTSALGSVFEETPAIAAQAWHHRPFDSIVALHSCMVQIVREMPAEDQLTLINAHPDLGSRAQMAPASVQEQAGAGLSQLSPEEYDRFNRLNQAYREKFQMPFILAVAGHTKASILSAFEARLNHSIEVERQTALEEIFKIAAARLHSWITVESSG